MARLPYVMETDPLPDDLHAVYNQIVHLRGGLLNLYRILGNQPPALQAFMGMSRYVRDESHLDPQLRELAILVTAYTLDVEYERVHHLAAATKVGVSEAKLRDLGGWRRSDAYTPQERAVMAYAEEVARSRQVTDETFAEVRRHFSPPTVVDLCLTVAWYHFVAALLLPLQVELEEPAPRKR
jgi:4-carboxymuconolactone decarboxylase